MTFCDDFHITCIPLQQFLIANLFAKISISGARKCQSLYVRPYRAPASERTLKRLLHLTNTGATMSVSSCISTRTGQTYFTQSLRARLMVSMQPSVSQLFTRETTNTRERSPISTLVYPGSFFVLKLKN